MVHVRKKFAKSERHSRLKDRHRIAASKLQEMDGILKLTEKYDIVAEQGSPSAIGQMLKGKTKPPKLPRLPAQQPTLPRAPTEAVHTAHWVTLKVLKCIAKHHSTMHNNPSSILLVAELLQNIACGYKLTA
eukprot:SAG31_NODE_4289_length_3376_cov_1044.267928_4_plen_131_part_00